MAARKNTRRSKTARRSGTGLPSFRVLAAAGLAVGGWVYLAEPGMIEIPGFNKPTSVAVKRSPDPEQRAQPPQPTPTRHASREPTREKAIVVPAGRPPAPVTRTARAEQPASPSITPTARPVPARSVAAPSQAAPAQTTPVQEGRIPAAPAPAISKGAILVVSAETELKAQASETSQSLAIIPRGSAVRLMASRDEWRLVSTSRRLGWIHRDRLEQATGSVRPSPQGETAVRRPTANIRG